MANEVLDNLLQATLASTIAIVLVLMLRHSLGNWFGHRVAYWAWSLVVLLPVAAMLPGPQWTSPALLSAVSLANAGEGVRSTSTASIWPAALVALWLAGGLSTLALQLRLQRRFIRQLGAIHRRPDGLYQSTVTVGLPAVLGLLKPRIILPLAFEERFDEQQRSLVVFHELCHLRRGDLIANACALLLRCVFWFNPLVHMAVSRFRRDQELACDELVIARHPHSRQAYAEAMLATQLAQGPLPLGCHWNGHHPLKERINMLNNPMRSRSRRATGLAVVLLLAGGASVGTWASQSPAATATIGHGPSMPPGLMGSPPRYPKAAADAKLGGQVMLLVDVGADGTVIDAKVERSEPVGVFDAAALEAVAHWKFQPALENGKPVPGRVRVPVDFRPDEAPPIAAPPGGEAEVGA